MTRRRPDTRGPQRSGPYAAALRLALCDAAAPQHTTQQFRAPYDPYRGAPQSPARPTPGAAPEAFARRRFDCWGLGDRGRLGRRRRRSRDPVAERPPGQHVEHWRSRPPVPAASVPAGSVEQVAAKVVPSVVKLEVDMGRQSEEGSGIILSSDGLILTNNHVVAAAKGGATSRRPAAPRRRCADQGDVRRRQHRIVHRRRHRPEQRHRGGAGRGTSPG